MTPDQFEQVEEMFDAVCSLPDSDGENFLRANCHDEEVVAKVRQLLLQDRADSNLIESHAEKQINVGQFMHDHATETSEIPKRIGRYTIIRELGRGGMGVVFLARQTNPNRHVALKVLHSGLMSSQTIRRFQYETEILGVLRHPGIAQIYESHVEDDTPYFAMEFIEGVSLRRFAEAHNLDFRAKLALMARVADAVHHAHLKGIVHRDLKPENILVVELDSVRTTTTGLGTHHAFLGQPKVLDFGVARATACDLQVTTMQTAAGQLIGTIPYMSPEQIAAQGDVDSRADVYALGVITFEFLMGELPFDLTGRSIPEAARIVLEEPPTRIGLRDSEYRGDVESIISRAMMKERDLRYQSAADFAADIRRHLSFEPILARPMSLSYQLSRFARRNKGLVWGALASVIFLILGTVVSTVMAVRASRYAAAARWNSYIAKVQSAHTALKSGEDGKARALIADIPQEYRGWEWRYLSGAAALDGESIDVTRWHGNTRRKAPKLLWRDERRLFILCDDSTSITLIEAGTSQPAWTLEVGAGLDDVAITRDGAMAFAYVRDTQRVLGIDMNTGDISWEWTAPASYSKMGEILFRSRLAVDHNGSRVSVMPDDTACYVLDRYSGGQLAHFPVHTKNYERLNGRLCRTAAPMFEVDGEECWCVGKNRIHKAIVVGRQVNEPVVVVSNYFLGDRWVAFMEGNSSIRVRRGPIGTRRNDSLLEGHYQKVLAIAPGPRSNQLGTVDATGFVRIWNLEDDSCIRSHDLGAFLSEDLADEPMRFSAIKFNENMVALATTRDVILLRNHQQRPTLASDGGAFYYATFSGDGTLLATQTWDNTLQLWNSANGDLIHSWPLAGAGMGDRVMFGFDDSGQTIHLLTNTADKDARIHIATDISSHRQTARKWDRTQGEFITNVGVLEVLSVIAAGSPIGAKAHGLQSMQTDFQGRLATTSRVTDGFELLDIRDGSLLLAVSDLPTLPRQKNRRGLRSCGISRDGSLVAVADPDGAPIYVYDGFSGVRLGTLVGHRARIYSLDFSPDNSRLITGGADNVAKLWDLSHFEQVLEFDDFSRFVHAVRFSSDGTRIVIASGDGTAMIADANLAEP